MSFIFGGNTGMSYGEIQRKRKIAESLALGMGTPKDVGEGLTAIGKALAIRGLNKKADAAEKTGRDEFSKVWESLVGGMGSRPNAGGAPAYTPPPDPNSPEGIAKDTMTALGKRSPYADAIASVESAGSGDYSAVGPDTGKGRAYGRYQVMDFNIGPWTEKYLGKRLTPEQFLADPAAQDAVFNGEFGGYVQKYGNPQDAASMWFSGRPMAEAGNASDGYNTVPQYVDKFSRAMGGQPMQAGGGPDIATLAQIAASPYADPGQKAVAQALLTQQMGAMDPNNQLDLEYKRAQIDALKNPAKKDDRTSAQKEYGQAVQEYILRNQPVPTFTEWQRGNKASGATTVNVGGPGEKKFDETIGGNLADKFVALQDGAAKAQSKLYILDGLKTALDEAGNTGFGAETALKVKRAARAIGLDIGDDVGPGETAIALGNQLALQLRSPSDGAGMPGAMSDKDREFLVASVPSLTKTPAGNRKLIDFMSRIEQRNIQVADFAQQYAAAHEGRLDSGFYAALRDWSGQNPLFSDADTMPEDGGWQTINGVKIRVKQ